MKNEIEIKKVIQFLDEVGIAVIEKELPDTTFLPGLEIENDRILVDYGKLKYPGDILHEAGHIAVTSLSERKFIGTDKMSADWPTQGDEIVSILWSFAALSYLNLDSDFVFHPDGYKGSSNWFIENFTSGNYMGLPLLQWFKMAYTNDEISENEKLAFPVMKNWLRPD